jgi:hypothetical protein
LLLGPIRAEQFVGGRRFARRPKKKKQISPPGEIFLLLRFGTLTS